MVRYRISATARIATPAARLYTTLADYRDGHPHILPNPPFVALVVEQGGWGAGTVFRLSMRLLGLRQTLRWVVTEPEPGRVLVETCSEQRLVTSFTVEERAGGEAADVTITTELPPRLPLVGAGEAWLLGRLLRPVYHKELGLLATWVAQAAVSTVGEGGG